MNIFILDEDIKTCAQYHCDQHVVKMILESVQMLCTTLNKRGFKTPYRSTHLNHPCVLWLDRSYDNFLWLKQLAIELNREYRYRYDKSCDHASIHVLSQRVYYRYASNGLSEFAQAIPGKYKEPGDAVQAYRNFYLGEKFVFTTWTRRNTPSWAKT